MEVYARDDLLALKIRSERKTNMSKKNTMNNMQMAFKKSGYKVRKTTVRWPSIKGRPQTITVTIDERTGMVSNVHFLVKE